MIQSHLVDLSMERFEYLTQVFPWVTVGGRLQILDNTLENALEFVLRKHGRKELLQDAHFCLFFRGQVRARSGGETPRSVSLKCNDQHLQPAQEGTSGTYSSVYSLAQYLLD